MSQLSGALSKSKSDKAVSFTIADTEFLIRFILVNDISGKDVEVASGVLSKIKNIHKSLMENKYGVL
tara:strand:+ start:190 stop:390 length:201 start_codon:yes stop_codon:yes gene_type:complete